MLDSDPSRTSFRRRTSRKKSQKETADCKPRDEMNNYHHSSIRIGFHNCGVIIKLGWCSSNWCFPRWDSVPASPKCTYYPNVRLACQFASLGSDSSHPPPRARGERGRKYETIQTGPGAGSHDQRELSRFQAEKSLRERRRILTKLRAWTLTASGENIRGKCSTSWYLIFRKLLRRSVFSELALSHSLLSAFCYYVFAYYHPFPFSHISFFPLVWGLFRVEVASLCFSHEPLNLCPKIEKMLMKLFWMKQEHCPCFQH